ncbi:hypothetical protein DSM43518_00640 [Mycobacterium marinum]|nr:hypothetical protein MM1218R_01413 [Mycobacterium marinum]CDM75562.1 hypothetical protein MMARE11_14140 [Mycobacterium marinum E11]AXN48824.1 hypothetical protein CCUG20998_01406 [Mycobacterium marinum]RFZ11585.1 hypothetical protein DE4381_01174 [Mycobacterium marinum]RFZ14619.1 hypothetical protein DSM43518_00640 [Mycobacterium marinum]
MDPVTAVAPVLADESTPDVISPGAVTGAGFAGVFDFHSGDRRVYSLVFSGYGGYGVARSVGGIDRADFPFIAFPRG